MARLADPDGHLPVQQQERLVVAAVDMHRGRVATPGMGLDHGELPAGDRGVEDDRELAAAGVGEPLMPGDRDAGFSPAVAS